MFDKSRSNNDFESVKVGIFVNSLFDNFSSNNDGKPENDPGSITEILFWKKSVKKSVKKSKISEVRF